MRILTDIELSRNYKEVKGVTSPLDTTESLNVSEISEKGGKFVYKTKDGEKEIKVDAGLGKVVIALSKEDWVDNGQGKFTYTITPAMLNLAPSVTYGIEMQVFNYNIMMWQRVAVTPNIDQEGNIIITSLSRLECNIIVTSGLILPPPKPNPTKIYGVDQVGRENPLDLPRTDDAVGMTYRLETVGNNQVYKSDFDNAAIYKDIKEVMDADGNVFIRIPKFYHKITGESSPFKVQISNNKVDETWQTLFINGDQEIDYMDIGKYEASGSNTKIYSKSAQTCLTNINMPNMRTACTSNGTGYHLYDIWNHQVIQLLFLVEFATTDSQSIMKGDNGSYAETVSTGLGNGILTGSPVSVTDYTQVCVYRGIENPWGRKAKWLDGVNVQLNGRLKSIYVCNDINKYACDKFDDGYTAWGTQSTINYNRENYCAILKQRESLALPIAYKNGKEAYKVYFCDGYSCYSNATYTSIKVSGGNTESDYVGLWYWGDIYPTSQNKYTSGRLCRKPIAGTNFD